MPRKVEIEPDILVPTIIPYYVSINAAEGSRIIVSENSKANVTVEPATFGNLTIRKVGLGSPKLELVWADEIGKAHIAEVKEIKGSGYKFMFKKDVFNGE